MDQKPPQASQPSGLPPSPMAPPFKFPSEVPNNAADDYLDMDDALHNFLSALWDSPIPDPSLLEDSAADRPPALWEPQSQTGFGGTADSTGPWGARLDVGNEGASNGVASDEVDEVLGKVFAQEDKCALTSVGECGHEEAQEEARERDGAKGKGRGRGKKRREAANLEADADAVNKPEGRAEAWQEQKVAQKQFREKRKVIVQILVHLILCFVYGNYVIAVGIASPVFPEKIVMV
eukprot:evm.model.scf_979.2 EVM.evm.TU.scf_979.2   scf_979:11334-12038(+)